MALQPFTGQLDQVSSLKPFDGKLDDEDQSPSLGDIAKGVGENILNLGAGAIGGLGGGLTYLGTLAATGGDIKAAKAVQEETNAKLTDWSKPTSKVGTQMQRDIQEGFQDIINAGGNVFEGWNSASGLGFDPEAMQAIGKAGTEMAMNVVDPLAAIHPLLHIGGPKELPIEHAAKIEPTLKPFEGELDPVPPQPVAAPEPTVANANDFAAMNPYDVAGHVTALEQGRPATIDQGQGDLFGGENLQSAQPQPALPVDSLLKTPDNAIPYTKEFPFALEDQTKPQTQMGINMPESESNLSLVPKEDVSVPEMNKTTVYPQALEANRAAMEAPIDTSNTAVRDAMRKAQQDQAYHDADIAKEKAYDELQNMQRAYEMRQREVETARLNGELDYQHLKDNVGDKTIMQPQHNAQMTEALNNHDVRGALDVISAQHPDPLYRQLASYLSSKADAINVTVHPEGVLDHGDRQVTGYFDPNTSTVGFSGVGAASPHTVMHETVHALTSQFLDARPTDVRSTALRNLYNKMDLSNFPSITNIKEFTAEAFSNPEFQTYLKKTNMDNRSMFSRFVDGVKSIFGIRPNIRTPMSTAFDHVIDLSKQVIEASDVNTRNTIMEQFKQAGVPSKLADYMTAPQADKPVTTNDTMAKAVEKMTGIQKIQEQFDFTPQAPEQVIAQAVSAPDIKAGALETFKANIEAGGRMASLRHSNNPVIKATFSYVDAAMKSYDKLVRDNITNAKNGIKPLLQKLSKDDFTILHSQMMMDEGQRVRTPQELAAQGWNQAQIDAYSRFRQVNNELLTKLNEVRAQMNPPLEPMTERIGHLAGRFLGDFSYMVYEKNPDGTRGDTVMRVNGSTSWGAQKIADFIKSEHPEWEIGDQEYNAINKGKNSDRFQGFREMMNFIGKNDPQVAKALDTLDKYNRSAATNYLNAVRHAKDKKAQAGGLIGSEGNKSWVDAQTNAEEGFKGHLAYLDSSYKWMEMQKAMENISKVTSNVDVIKQQPNAIKWSTAYTDHALHKNQGFLADFANSLISEVGKATGIGHTNLQRGINFLSSAEMRNWMGFLNVPFALKHLVLPLQKMPAMLTYLKTQGAAEGGLVSSGLKAMESYAKYIAGNTKNPEMFGKPDAFQKQAFQYAKDHNVFNVSLSDVSGQIQSSKGARMLGKVMDADFSIPEHAIRATGFFTYAHLLESSGMKPEAALSAAEHLSDFLYTDYSNHEAPRITAKAGWMSQLAFQVTRYKANEIGQLGFFNRERISMTDKEHSVMQKVTSNLPLMVHLGSLAAFTGATGMVAYKEADEIYSLFMKHVMGNPDNLTAVMQRSNAPDLIKYGLSSLLGIDSKITEAELFPSPFPTTSTEISQIGMAWNAARYHDAFHAKQLALSMVPSTFRGYAENKMFTEPTSKPGVGLYTNPNTGKGRIYRDEKTQALRNLGFHTTAETNELNNTYSANRIMQDNSDLAAHVLEKAKGAIASGTLDAQTAQELGKEYMKHQQAGDPDFAGALTSYMESRHMSQREQELLRLSNSDKMGNGLKIFMGK